MEIDYFTSDFNILVELGKRIKTARIRAEKTQEQLAKESGVAKSTIERAEKGESVQFLNVVKILRALNLLQNLETLLPSSQMTPIEYVEETPLPSRVRFSKKTANTKSTFKWGDEQ